MVKPSDALKDFLILLFQKQDSAWVTKNPKDKPSKRALDTYDAIKNRWIPITFNEIEPFFNESQLDLDFSDHGKVLYLPPIKKESDFVPILSLDCKWKEKQWSVGIKVMLVCCGNCTDENQIPSGIGFRLETPEIMNQPDATRNNEGIHDFYHAQLIKKFGKKKLDRKLQVKCPNWLPKSQPSFPLPARCPMSLMFCLIATLYGRKKYGEYRDEFPNQNAYYHGYDVREHLEELDQWIEPEINMEETKLSSG